MIIKYWIKYQNQNCQLEKKSCNKSLFVHSKQKNSKNYKKNNQMKEKTKCFCNTKLFTSKYFLNFYNKIYFILHFIPTSFN